MLALYMEVFCLTIPLDVSMYQYMYGIHNLWEYSCKMLALRKFFILVFDSCICIFGLGSFFSAVRMVISPSFGQSIYCILIFSMQKRSTSKVE